MNVQQKYILIAALLLILMMVFIISLPMPEIPDIPDILLSEPTKQKEVVIVKESPRDYNYDDEVYIDGGFYTDDGIFVDNIRKIPITRTQPDNINIDVEINKNRNNRITYDPPNQKITVVPSTESNPSGKKSSINPSDVTSVVPSARPAIRNKPVSRPSVTRPPTKIPPVGRPPQTRPQRARPPPRRNGVNPVSRTPKRIIPRSVSPKKKKKIKSMPRIRQTTSSD